MCFGSLLCWNTTLRGRLWREGTMLCFNMSTDMVKCMFPKMTCSFPRPAISDIDISIKILECRHRTLITLFSSWLPPHTLGSHQQISLLWCHLMSERVSSDSYSSFAKVQPPVCGLPYVIFRRKFILSQQQSRLVWCSVLYIVWALAGWPLTCINTAAMLEALLHPFSGTTN